MSSYTAIMLAGYPGTILRAGRPTREPYPEIADYPFDAQPNPNTDPSLIWPPPISSLYDGVANARRLDRSDVVPVCPLYYYNTSPIPGFLQLTILGGSLPESLRIITRSSGRTTNPYVLGFGYDWRRDFREAAAKLAVFVKDRAVPGTKVMFAAHSAGGLVVRYLLECGLYDGEPWFANVSDLVMFGTPNQGTAVSLALAAGVSTTAMIDPAEGQRLTAKREFNGASCLFPPPGVPCAFEDTAQGRKPIDIYASKANATKFGLSWDNVMDAKAFTEVLAKNRRPAHVAYTLFHGTRQETPLAIVKSGAGLAIETTKEGDGTTTIASALGAPLTDTIVVPFCKHLDLPTDGFVNQELRVRFGGVPVATDAGSLAALLPLMPFGARVMPTNAASATAKANAFDRALAQVLRHEGGYVDHPRDPGGATNLGITIATLSRWLKRPATKAEVRALTPATVAPIYRAYYWLPVKGDEMPAGVDFALFDYAVNSGVGRAVRHLQEVLGVTVDGAIGGESMAAIARQHPDFVIRALCERRLEFLKALPTWPTFGRGWQRRVEEVEDAALEMATGVPHGATPAVPEPGPRRSGRAPRRRRTG